jgi:hypothetical protein
MTSTSHLALSQKYRMPRGGARNFKGGIPELLASHPEESFESIVHKIITAHSCQSTRLCLGFNKTCQRLEKDYPHLVKYLTKRELHQIVDQECRVVMRLTAVTTELSQVRSEIQKRRRHILACSSAGMQIFQHTLRRLVTDQTHVIVLDKIRNLPVWISVCVTIRVQEDEISVQSVLQRRIYHTQSLSEAILSEIKQEEENEAKQQQQQQLRRRQRAFFLCDSNGRECSPAEVARATQLMLAEHAQNPSYVDVVCHPFGFFGQSLCSLAESTVSMVKRYIKKKNDQLNYNQMIDEVNNQMVEEVQAYLSQK